MDFARLYKKEFMKGRRSFAAVIVITLGIMFFLFTRIGRWDEGMPTLTAIMMIFGFCTAAFIKSFDYLKEEWRHNNQYLMLSLPIKGYDIIGAKLAYFLTEFSSHILLLGAYTIMMMLAELRSPNTISNKVFRALSLSAWRAYGLCILPALYILLGAGVVGLFAYTVTLTVKKFGFWVGTASYIFPIWLLSNFSSRIMKISPDWMHIEIPLSKALALSNIENAFNKSGGVINISGMLNGAYIGIDLASVAVWTVGLAGLFLLASWLIENKVEV